MAMGGSGSGWHRGRKIAVENCIVLDSAEMAARCFDLPDDALRSRKVHGISPTGLHFMTMGTERKNPAVRINSLAGYGSELILEQMIRFLSAGSHVYDLRWWFSCPQCGRRVRKLYLPRKPESKFACRNCHKLTYRTVQRHQKIRVPAILAKLLNSGQSDEIMQILGKLTKA
jgi:hypothetical protein